jgi:probable HAF family extracellular repeat protein
MTSRRHFIGFTVGVLLVVASSPALAQVARAYTAEDLGSFGGQDLVGLAVNDLGEVAGYGYLADGTIHAFRWTLTGGLEDLGTNGGSLSQAIGINNNGDVVGVYVDASGGHGFVAPRGGVMRDLRTSDRPIVRINAITDNGQMTGFLLGATTSFQAHAFRTLTDGTLQDLGNTVYASVDRRSRRIGRRRSRRGSH